MATKNNSYAVSAGHDLAAGIAADILDVGGNAVDAGVAASIALTVLHSEQVQFGGVAPILVYLAGEDRCYSIEGAGRWPTSADPQYFETNHRGRIPQGILRTVVPAAPDAWLTALARFGSMSFADVASPAQSLAKEGFPAHEDLAACSAQFQRSYMRMGENAKFWLVNDAPIDVGHLFVQSKLADCIGTLVDADRKGSAKKGRTGGLQAVRDLFYKGDMANIMIRHVKNHDGWLTHADLAAHKTPVVSATTASVFSGTLFTPGPWTQAPALSQALQILDAYGISKLPSCSVDAFHLIIEALKLALVDREAYYGDPEFIDVPLTELLSPEYTKARASLIDKHKAASPLPPAGEFRGHSTAMRSGMTAPETGELSLDTSVAAIIDGEGNIFASTPSDASFDGPVVPELGFVLSTRGAQSYVAGDHPASLRPGKRPRVSAYPMIFKTANGGVIAGGGPGADLQLQAMAQTLAGHIAQGLPLVDAVAAPRVFTHSIPSSTEPHLASADKVMVEEAINEDFLDALTARGHKSAFGAASGISRPSICLVADDPSDGLQAVADPRRASGQRLKSSKPERTDK
ncbi:gamma-glutamyltransferase family protein [Sneathiella chungangensis]|uniref:Gamma-glutamyltransferase family protein n=1 Tax=Sneathiella chungangensis TaxID=1418234 RepID=A0A845MHI9_9PROT|nr:gamma-glutamyltransferase [Sneathiella chungangensis]MZR22890.1 gamma-glutamyltransferase family protein [Sneathiella chungangensis]